MTLDELNNLSSSDATHAFAESCASRNWVRQMVAARPFANIEDLLNVSDRLWLGLSEADFLEAFEAHPQIGNVDSLRAKYAGTKTLAAGEQSSVAVASEKTLQDLADGNRVYLEKFGFIFIVFATGKSAEQMLSLLRERLPNDRQAEIKNAAEEQRKITVLRLRKLLGAADTKEDKKSMSQITTHILDTARGSPAAGVPVSLSLQVADAWQLLATGTTNSDGRVTDLLPEERVLAAGIYKMHFDTGAYFSTNDQKGFYPWAEVVFEINGGDSHYHIPLLLSPFGYSTYRGS